MRFDEVFTDGVYADGAGEAGPFAAGDGADIWAEWSGRAEELGDVRTLEGFLELEFAEAGAPADGGALADGVADGADGGVDGGADDEGLLAPLRDWADHGLGGEDPEIATEEAWLVLRYGFTFLRATMRLDTEGRDAMLAALTVLGWLEGETRELDVMRRDLEAWEPTDG